MDIAPTFEAAVTAQRTALLRDIANAAQAASESGTRKAATQLSDTAQNLMSLNTGAAFSTDPARGRNLDIFI